MTPVDPALATASPPPAPASAEQPAKRTDKPHRDRHPRREGPRDHHPRKHEAPKAVAHKAEKPKHEKPRQEKPAQEKRHRREERDDAPSHGPGMGPNTPAFLLRPVPQHLIKRKKEPETA